MSIQYANFVDVSESMDHVFFHCTRAIAFWGKLTNFSTTLANIDSSMLNTSNWHNTRNYIKNKPFNKWIPWGNVIPFNLWESESAEMTTSSIIKKSHISTNHIITQATEFQFLTQKTSNAKASKIPIQNKWNPQPWNTFKLNIDGVVVSQPGVGVTWGVIKNHNRKWVVGFIKTCAHQCCTSWTLSYFIWTKVGIG